MSHFDPRRRTIAVTNNNTNYGRNSFRPPLPFHLPQNRHHLSLVMLQPDQVLAQLSNKHYYTDVNVLSSSSMGLLHDLSEETMMTSSNNQNNDFATAADNNSTYQQSLLSPTQQQPPRLLTPPPPIYAAGYPPAGSISTITANTLHRQASTPRPLPNNAGSFAEIRYPDFEQWIQTAGNISYVTSVMLARSKSESTLSEMSDMTNTRRKLFPMKKQQRRSRLNYHDLSKSELRDGIRQHHIALLRWTNLVGRLSKQVSSAFGEFSKQLEKTATELRVETEKTNRMFKTENSRSTKPTFILGRTLDKIWLTVLDNISDQARIFNDLSKTLTHDFAPSFTELIDHHETFIGQIYAFECGLEHLLTEYRETTSKSSEVAELAKQLALNPADPRQIPRSGLGSLVYAVDAQNAYVLNLHNYNTMVTQYENALMPVLIEEMEDASIDLMTYGVKFLDAVTQLVGKRYGELKGRMEVVEYACRYQSKARSDISAYVRAYLDTRHHQQVSAQAPSFTPIPVSPKNQLLAVEENENKLAETVDALSEEIYDMADLRRTKQIELEKLEEKYHVCLSNINTIASTATSAANGGGGNNCETASGGGKSSSGGGAGHQSSIVKEALPSFSCVTFKLKENIADARRMVALATAKLNSLKHQMDLLSTTRRQQPPQNLEAELRGQGSTMGAGNNNGRPTRLPHQPGGRKKGLRRSLTQWFSFLHVSNEAAAANKGYNSAAMLSGGGNISPDFGDDPDADGDYQDTEYHPKFRTGDPDLPGGADDFVHNRGGGGVNRRNSGKTPPDADYHNDYGDMMLFNGAEGGPDEDESTLADMQNKQKTTIFSVKGFKKTIDRLRRIASEEHPSMPKRRKDAHRAQSHDPDPVYALLKCAAKLHNVNLETHASNCTCDECPARRLVSGVSSSLMPASLALTLPGGSGAEATQAVVAAAATASSASVLFRNNRPPLLSQQQQDDQQMLVNSAALLPEHPANFSRNRLSSGSVRGAGQPLPFSPNNRNSMIVMPSSFNTSPTSITPPYYQHQNSLTNLRR